MSRLIHPVQRQGDGLGGWAPLLDVRNAAGQFTGYVPNTVRVPGFSLPVPHAPWCTLNRFRTGQGRCASCLKKWDLSSSELCACGDTEMMSHIVESCSINELDGGILRLHSADETAVQWPNTLSRVTHTTTTTAVVDRVDRTAEQRRIETATIPHASKQEAKQTLGTGAPHSLARRNIPTLIDATCPAPAGRPAARPPGPAADGIPRTARVIHS